MGFIENNLMVGERIMGQARLHWIVYFWPAAIAIISLGAPFVGMIGSGTLSLSLAVVAPLGLIVAAIWGLSAFINMKTSEFAVTDKRVLMKIGWIRRHSLEIFLEKVEGIQVDQGIIGRIFGYGSIIVSGTGGMKDPFHRIAAPLEFRRQVHAQTEIKQGA